MRQIQSCNVCRKPAIFNHNGKGWCGTVAMMGMFNHFGHCIKKGVDSPELIKYEKSHKGEK